MSRELVGWVLSIYPDENDGAVVWLLGEDGKRHRLRQAFESTFYLGGDPQRLRAIQGYLRELRRPPQVALVLRRDLFKGPLPILAVKTGNPVSQEKLVALLKRKFRQVRYYDANIPFPIRYCAAREIFPTARCRALVGEGNRIMEIEALDSPWDLEYALPPIRALAVEPDVDPHHARPDHLVVQAGDDSLKLGMEDEAQLLTGVMGVLDKYDPDLIVARWGDGWLFPYLMEIAGRHGIDFNPGRDPRQKVLVKEERTYFSYGSVFYRARQTYLFGRWHVDPENTSMFGGFSVGAAVEMARLTGVDVQTAARNSPGSGFTAMQMAEALRRGVLVPDQKRQTERPRPAMAFNLADSGGLNYRPLIGLHTHVAELDFFSMYPQIEAEWNISGETVGVWGKKVRLCPQTGVPVSQDEPGLVAALMRPVIEKRRAAKRERARLPPDDPRYEFLGAVADCLKWLGWVSFGYQGFKNNLFGNVQAHEAINAVGREMLTRAKEAAHDLSFRVLGANTDSLFVQKPGASRPEDFEPLMAEIVRRTGLTIELEGVFQWLAFLPSKHNPRVAASNRYYGKFSDGSLKVRGMAQRRSDTPNWIADAEREIMELLATEAEGQRLKGRIPEALALTRRCFAALDAGQVALGDLVCTNKLSRELDEYKNPSPAASAAGQLAAAGKQVRVGQRVRFLYTHGSKSSVWAWDRPEAPDYAVVNKARYKELLLRTVHQILLPLGLDEKDLHTPVNDGVQQLELWSQDPFDRDDYDEPEDELSLAEVLFAPYLPPPD